MKKYEIMFIVKPTLGEDVIKQTSKKFEDILTTNGATVSNVKEMGQKELAYEINKIKTGYYFVFNVESKDDKAIQEFDRLALINEDILRHLIINVEK